MCLYANKNIKEHESVVKKVKLLESKAAVMINGKCQVHQAFLVTVVGGRRVKYFDSAGNEVYSEPLFKSQFKNSPAVKQDRAEFRDTAQAKQDKTV